VRAGRVPGRSKTCSIFLCTMAALSKSLCPQILALVHRRCLAPAGAAGATSLRRQSDARLVNQADGAAKSDSVAEIGALAADRLAAVRHDLAEAKGSSAGLAAVRRPG